MEQNLLDNYIYFDENKQAYDIRTVFKLKIKPVCIISQEVWNKYAGTDKWDIIGGNFVDISNTLDWQQQHQQEYKNNLLIEIDNIVEQYKNNSIQYKQYQIHPNVLIDKHIIVYLNQLPVIITCPKNLDNFLHQRLININNIEKQFINIVNNTKDATNNNWQHNLIKDLKNELQKQNIFKG